MNYCVPKFKAMHSTGAVITLVIPREGPLGERRWGLGGTPGAGKQVAAGQVLPWEGAEHSRSSPHRQRGRVQRGQSQGDGPFSLAQVSAESSKLGGPARISHSLARAGQEKLVGKWLTKSRVAVHWVEHELQATEPDSEAVDTEKQASGRVGVKQAAVAAKSLAGEFYLLHSALCIWRTSQPVSRSLHSGGGIAAGVGT